MDVFDYSDHFFYRLARANDIGRPIQIELHPGVNCDLYRCPHCYGHGQSPMPGDLISPEEIGDALDDVAAFSPAIIVSGITTEPLTHPRSGDLIRQVRRRKLSLGLYTKGRRLEGDVADALLEGSAECFLTVSLDDVVRADYNRRHSLKLSSRESAFGLSGSEYFDRVLDNLRKFKLMRDARQANVEIRISLLLFADNSDALHVTKSVAAIVDLADMVRIAFPQNRNDGFAPGTLPPNSRAVLDGLSEQFAQDSRVKILRNCFAPERNREFRVCRVQQFQAVIDRSGNLFPCPQVAVSPFRHLCYGNIRERRFSDLLAGQERRRVFAMNVDGEMKCRICDRKDEAVNVALHELAKAYDRDPGASS
jgi:radical SAM protein with 4Fe4S-binding SPASM domain